MGRGGFCFTEFKQNRVYIMKTNLRVIPFDFCYICSMRYGYINGVRYPIRQTPQKESGTIGKKSFSTTGLQQSVFVS